MLLTKSISLSPSTALHSYEGWFSSLASRLSHNNCREPTASTCHASSCHVRYRELELRHMWANQTASYVHIPVCVVPGQGRCMAEGFNMSLFHTVNDTKLRGNEANFFHASATSEKVQLD